MNDSNKITPFEVFLLIAFLIIMALAVYSLMEKAQELDEIEMQKQSCIENSIKADKPINSVKYKNTYYDIPIETKHQAWRCSDDR